jgi:hypothetical protein
MRELIIIQIYFSDIKFQFHQSSDIILSEIEDKKASLAIMSKKLDDLIKANFSQQD